MPRRSKPYTKVHTQVEDPCAILKKRADEEQVAAETYKMHATQANIFNPQERQMFEEQGKEEEHHLQENRRAQIMRGCIR